MNEAPVVLIADDNKINRVVVRATFRGSNYRLLEATDGEEAVRLAREHLPDLILMDLMMPGVDGLEATRRLKGEGETSRIPILMLTALNDTEDRISAFDAGVTGFLTKPFDRLELLAHVRSYINLSLINKRYILSTANRHTGLPNQFAFSEKFGEYADPVLLLLQVDDIDKINSFYGEEKASQFESHFADYILKALPDSLREAELFHFHRGSFGLLLENVEQKLGRRDLIALAEQLHGSLATYDESAGGVDQVSDYSIAISTKSERIYDDAYVALRSAEQTKSDVVFAPDVAHSAYRDIRHNMQVLQMIRRACKEKAIVPFFQPILHNGSGRVTKYEALVRLRDEEGRIVSPAAFLLVAKTSRYYDIITRIMLQRSMEIFEERSEELSVNLSVMDIENGKTREYILALLGRYPSVARRLTIALVEEESIRHYDRVKEFIDTVKSHGVRVAIDDFGSGYSNFQRILELEVDFIKIDGSIVRHIAENPVYRNLASVIRQFARFSGIPIIAEFVENRAIQDVLLDLEIEYSQGYFVGKPDRLDVAALR
jgi:EAL domain-containing protein (putative c-di-GMP-specific phosphodiesterase class I)/ActR/RegA family two-component response regulator